MDRTEEIKFINNLREKDIWCNAKITSNDGRSISVHSAVMMTQSEFFWAVFQFGPNDGKKGTERTRVFVPCVDGSTLDLVVRYAYTGEIDINKSNVWAIIRAADFLLMPLLLEKSLTFLTDCMSFSICVKLLEFTESRLYLPSVRNVAINYALCNFCEPAFPLSLRKNCIQGLSVDSLEELLSHNMLNAPREELVWEAIVSWAEQNHQTADLARLIKTLRFGYVRSHYVMQNILDQDFVKESPELTSLVKNIEQELEDWLLADNPVQSPPQSLQPRVPHSFVLAVGGWVGPAPSHEILLYDPQVDSWTRVESLECPQLSNFAYHGLVQLGDWLYIVGGTESTPRRGSSDTARVLRLNLTTFTWQKIADLSFARNFLCCVELGGLIYAFGGRSRPRHRHNSAEVFDPDTEQWTSISPMNCRRSDAGYAVLNGKIYAVGGFNGEIIQQTAEYFDPTTGEWNEIAELSIPRSGLRCVSLRGHLFAFGGYSGSTRLATVERYDPETDSWSFMQPMRVPRSNMDAVAWRDYIIVSGGYGGNRTITTSEMYDIFEDRWYDLAQLPSARSALKMINIECEPELAARLLGDRRETPGIAAHRRNRSYPSHMYEIPPLNTPLPSGHTTVHTEPTHWPLSRAFMVRNNELENEWDIDTLEDIDEMEEWLEAEPVEDDDDEGIWGSEEEST